MVFGEDLNAPKVARVREWIATHPAGAMGYGITGDSLRRVGLVDTAANGREILTRMQAEGFVVKSLDGAHRQRWFSANRTAVDETYGKRTDAYRGRL